MTALSLSPLGLRPAHAYRGTYYTQGLHIANVDIQGTVRIGR
jgi:hypothetical protein